MVSQRTGLHVPYLTHDLPGTGGDIKSYDEDFVVEEVPLYEPSGEGTHCYFKIEKTGLTTPVALRMIANALDRHPRDIGYAGQKDAHGVTRQWMSLEHIESSAIEGLRLNRIRATSVQRHTNKLKLGHLRGNRFIVRIRNMVDCAADLAQPVVDVLTSRGLPNYFGPQRFGVRGDNAQVGKAVLCDDYEEAIALLLGRPTELDHGESLRARQLYEAGDYAGAQAAWPSMMANQRRVCRTMVQSEGNFKKAWKSVDHSMRKFYISALQSELFNKVLAKRVNEIDRLMTGDVAWKHHNGACFLVEDAETEQPRCDEFEISPTGPLFGRKMKEPEGAVASVEAGVLEEAGMQREQIRARDGSKLDGARRPLRVPVEELSVDSGSDSRGAFLELSFFLPPGSYATCVTREICKTG